MNQKYADFRTPLLESIEEEFADLLNNKQFQNTADKGVVTRIRVLLKLSAELVLCGIAESPGYCIKIVRKLTRAGMKTKNNSETVLSNDALAHHQAVVSFVRSYGYEFMGMKVPKHLESIEREHGVDLNSSEIMMKSLQDRTNDLIVDYYNCLVVRLKKEHEGLCRRRERNKEELLNRGSLSKTSIEYLEKYKEAMENILKIVETMAGLLGKEIPLLEDNEDIEESADKAAGIALWDRRREADGNTEESMEAFMYGGEETRSFYQDLIDIRAMVPMSMLSEVYSNSNQDNDSEEQKQQNTQQTTKKSSVPSSKGTLDQALQQLGFSEDQPTPSYTATLSPPENAKPVAQPNPTEKPNPDPSANMAKAKKSKKIDIDDYIEEYDNDDEDEDDFDTKQDKSKTSREVQELLATLPNCLSRDSVDKFCVEFCHVTGSNKQAKNSLLRELRYIPWNRSELIPYYARVAATLSQVFEDLGPKLAGRLLGQFKFLSKTTSMDKLESRLRNARYIGELVKFNLNREDLSVGIFFPSEKIFFVLNQCFKNFAGSNINYLCELFESAGRYLYRNPDTHAAMGRSLETLWRFRKQKNLSPAHNNLIDNAYYFSKTTDTQIQRLRKKKTTPQKQYVEYLFFDYLGKVDQIILTPTSEKKKSGEKDPLKKLQKIQQGQCSFVIQKLLKLSWNSKFAQVVELVTNTVLKTYKFRTDSIPLVARIVVNLSDYYPKFGDRFVDALIERMEMGMQTNDHRYHQKRLRHARLFAELYNSRLVDTPTFFNTLYLIINFGHALPWPEHIINANKPGTKEEMVLREEIAKQDRANHPRGPDIGGCRQDDANKFHPLIPFEMDPPDDAFRVRLVCEMVNTLGNFVRFGNLSKRIDRFWLYFERYAYSKTGNTQFIHHQMNDALQTLKSVMSTSKKSQKKRSQSLQTVEKLEAAVRQALASRPKTAFEAAQRVETLEKSEAESKRTADSYSLEDELEDEENERELEEEVEDEDDEEDDEVEEGNDDEEEEDDEDEDEDDESDDDDDDDSESLTEDEYDEERFDLEAQAEKQFEQEFAQLIQYNQPQFSQVVGASAAHNMAIPKHLLRTQKDENDAVLKNKTRLKEDATNEEAAEPGVEFRLIKRGTKGRIETKSMFIPEETVIAKTTRKDEAAERREHELMKKLVLQYEQTHQYEAANSLDFG